MYAIIETGGKQYKVAEGDVLFVEKLDAEEGASVTFDEVLAVSDGDNVKVGTPLVEGAKVTAKVEKNGKGKKISITDASGKTSTKTYNGSVVYGSSAMLFTDDNFIGGENNLDAITEPKYSVEQIRATDFENFAQDNFPTITSGEN